MDKPVDTNEIVIEHDLETSLLDFDLLHRTIKMFCTGLAHSRGLRSALDLDKLKSAHSQWISVRESWLKSDLACGKTTELNHFKSFAILLHHLSTEEFVTFDIRAEDETSPAMFNEYKMLQNLDSDRTYDLLDGQHHYIAWLLTLECIDNYEDRRTDKATKYQNPVNVSFEHEMVTMLKYGKHEPVGLYVTLYGLFLRDDKETTAH